MWSSDYVCVCVCVSERERERGAEIERKNMELDAKTCIAAGYNERSECSFLLFICDMRHEARGHHIISSSQRIRQLSRSWIFPSRNGWQLTRRRYIFPSLLSSMETNILRLLICEKKNNRVKIWHMPHKMILDRLPFTACKGCDLKFLAHPI